MTRIGATILVLAGLLAAAFAGPAGAAPLPVKARASACVHGLEAIDRSFDTSAAMSRIRGTRRMGIRFDLQVRRPGQAAYHKVPSSSGFGEWFKSKRGVGAYRYSRTTNGLAAPAYFRMRVGFRWYGASGKAIKTAHRVTNRCFQPDLRPDLVVRGAARTRRDATRDWYAFRIVNRGRTTAVAPFDVTLTFPGTAARRKTIVTSIAPGGSLARRFSGPSCTPLDAPELFLDPGDAVAEAREQNNAFGFVCP